MRGNPILDSLRTAEAAGYPALLIVSAVCLGLVVGPVALLGLTDASWVLGLALLYLIVALVVLSVAVGAALSEGDEPDAEEQAPGSRGSDKRSSIERLPSAGSQPGRRTGIAGPGARSQPSRSLGTRRRHSALPARVAQMPPRGAARRSAPEGPPPVTVAESAPAGELAGHRLTEGRDARERGAPTPAPGDGPRLDTRRVPRVKRRLIGRRRRYRG